MFNYEQTQIRRKYNLVKLGTTTAQVVAERNKPVPKASKPPNNDEEQRIR